jgi:alpha-galactosidase
VTAHLQPVVERWVRRVWAGEAAPLGSPGLEGWWAPELPFSFRYGGQPAAQLLPQWLRHIDRTLLPEGRTVYRLLLADPATGLEVTWEAATYPDLPAVEWVLFFRNGGTTMTPLLEEVRALDLTLATDHHELVVYFATGGHATPDAFQPHAAVLSRTEPFRLAAVGGRSSNGVLPYFNVEATWDSDRGVMVAVGWTGQWEAVVTRLSAGPPPVVEPDLRGPHPQLSRFRNATRLRIEAGMQDMHLSLYPGERIRTPRILLIPWEHDRLHGHNLLRRFLHQHVAPKLDGAPPLPAMWCSLGIIDPKSGTLGAGFSLMDLSLQGASLPVDYVLVDAGWYTPTEPGASWAASVGNYRVRSDLFPAGLRPLADAVHRAGKGFGLWFEPERVAKGSEFFREHQEWLYPTPLGQSYIVNLGLPEARSWLIDTISRLIDEIGIDWYRHDANADYLPVWRASDPPDRRGISEIRHIEGLYALWSDLMARYPRLYMEGCASGGRRMDFEALRYHHGYFFTDWMVGDPCGMQSIVHGASLWFPGNYMHNVMGPQAAPITDTAEQRYGFFSALGGGMMFGWRAFTPRASLDLDLGRRWMAEFRRLRHLAVGDFYPLLPYTLSEGHWLAAQWDRPELGEGMVVAFRRRYCPRPSVLVQLQGLVPEAMYRLRWHSTGLEHERAGHQLMAGVTITLPQAPAHEVLHYWRL